MDELVWVAAHQLSERNSVNHTPLATDSLEVLGRIKSLLDDVYPQSLDKWTDMIERDGRPEVELELWSHIAETYNQIVESSKLTYN